MFLGYFIIKPREGMVTHMDTNNEQLDLFENPETGEKEESRNLLDIVEVRYVQSHRNSWQELFEGFSDIKVITFSSGINFTCKLLNMFDTAEVIFGCEELLSGKEKNIFAFQTLLIEKIQKNKNNYDRILERVTDKTAHFYVSRQKLSHEKIFLLKDDDGKTRVIFGSANMSYNAFSGRQRENILFDDSTECYEHYVNVFEELKMNSVDEIGEKHLKVKDIRENPDKLPISTTVKSEGILYLEKQFENEETQFVLDTRLFADELEPMIPKLDKKENKIRITSDLINSVKRRMDIHVEKEREYRNENPQLIVDIEEEKVTLNGKEYDLNPNDEEVNKDVKLFLEYMNGYKDFHGDSEGTQYRYFEFANWFFASPFMAVLRDMASRYDVNVLPYPVFGLLYGQSKAGKTTFLETLLKMMIGQKPKMAAPDFTRRSIDSMKKVVKGAPIIVDDVTQLRFNQHAIETIKNDQFGVAEHKVNYPAVVISANEDVKAAAPEIIRRTVICRVEAGLTNTEVMQNSLVKKVQKNIGTAFYRKYLSRMIPIVKDMLEKIKDDDAESPDILKESSRVICEIIEENNSDLPFYIRQLSLLDYFSEKVTGKYAIKTITNAWKINKKSFVIDEKNNELRYNTGQIYEAERIRKELPENLEVRKTREWLIMNLEESRKFFELPFKLSLLQRLFSR